MWDTSEELQLLPPGHEQQMQLGFPRDLRVGWSGHCGPADPQQGMSGLFRQNFTGEFEMDESRKSQLEPDACSPHLPCLHDPAAWPGAVGFGCDYQGWVRSCARGHGARQRPGEKLPSPLPVCSIVIRHQLGLVSGLQTVSSPGLSPKALSSVSPQH